MKQLILYFLFFVGFALILIQCAWLFPSDSKLPINPTKAKTQPQINKVANNQNNTAANLIHAANYDFSVKNTLFLPIFYSIPVSRTMVSRNNTRRRGYNKFILKPYSFAINYDEKALDQKKY